MINETFKTLKIEADQDSIIEELLKLLEQRCQKNQHSLSKWGIYQADEKKLTIKSLNSSKSSKRLVD